MQVRRGGGAGITGACLLALGLIACGSSRSSGGRDTAEAGMAGEDSAGGAGASSSGGSATAGGVSNGGASGGVSGGAGMAGAVVDGGAGASELFPVPSELRRLTASEYGYTVQDVLGTSLRPQLAGFATEVSGFDNNANANGVSEALYFRYLETAEQLADEVFGSSTLRAQVVSCEAVDDVECVRQIAAELGLRLFRHPLVEEELDAYQDAYDRARERELTHHGAVKEMLVALLASAQFLYRMEYPPTDTGAQPISPYELATRLSYLLWSSAPDSALFEAAAQSELGSDEQVEQSVDRMLSDARARRFTLDFAGQWLGARQLTTVSFDAASYPQWGAAVATAAADEMYAHFERLLDEDREITELLDSRGHFVDASLAPLYGLSSPGASATWVELEGVDRKGLLGLVGFLAGNSAKQRTAPSRRGRFISERLLCQPVGSAPDDMPVYNGSESGVRSHLEGVSEQASCGFCHSKIDALGLALENYDAIGKFRSVYGNAAIIDSSVTLRVPPALPEGSTVGGVASLSDAIAASPAFAECVALNLYTYGTGRFVAGSERGNVAALTEQWQSGSPTLRALILRLSLSPTFRLRSDGGAL